MNESYKNALALSRKLLVEAKENEPDITENLQNIASEVSAEMVELENKFKSEESLARKLSLFAAKDKSKQSIQQKLAKFARRNNDALRYTFIIQNDDYRQDIRNTIERLEKSGFQIPPNRIWNAWENAGTQADSGYRGVNITVISSQTHKFELQFHTAESFRLKTETHHLYRELRDLGTSDERRKEIVEETLRLAKRIERPKGI